MSAGQQSSSSTPPPPSPSPGQCDASPRYIEEGRNAYRPGGFHPVYIGDVYHGRYEVLNKIGYGAYSTVWLVNDKKTPEGEAHKFFALKVLSAECYGAEKDIFEREVLKSLRDGDRKQLGYSHVCHLVDDFEHEGPNGTHVCLVFELIGETLRSFGAWFPDSMIPNQVMRRFTIQLLLALDFAHEHKVIHTDIQPSNIFVKLRDYTLIESGYLVKVAIPHQDRSEEKYTVLPSRPLRQYYFKEDDRFDHFDIALGDWGVSSWADKHLTEKIQPVALRAPEVLIGAPWDAAVDMWNLGAITLELFLAVRMFSGAAPPHGHYELKQHLAEVVNLFGPFPKALLDKGDQDVVEAVFDDHGMVKGLPPSSMDTPDDLSDYFPPEMDADVGGEFIAFMQSLMKIDPAERPSPEDVLRGPWLRALK
ncbi:serine/threonine protein kinase [Colletotrichum higginsianum]|uniref:non-specific serine/threonine protein kinase n=2 Tax=Colletotrichum higginsianum TaxID=80884 RepID=H1VLH0_COLHI|nr:Serine/threonine protein kinase [Colletotrichum higginsianum IMI 349063]OBR12966.1 Serine/threonine protein kinase [Colletotrichum higginsianum IMI 349063]TIC99238.1 Serine/threonine-protein kinase SRPK [Colletotrichum higginsianum]CCF41073.1 serine/threonine protein kinase [Colletotrichum higginsianum]